MPPNPLPTAQQLREAVMNHLANVAKLTDLRPNADKPEECDLGAIRPNPQDKKGEPRHRVFRLVEVLGEELIRLRIDGHHCIEASGVVVDLELGSLGLIHYFGPKDKSRPSWLSERIDEAAYIRHVLAQRRSTEPNPSGHLLPAVELVILLSAELEANARGEFERDLRDTLKQTSLLHAVSIGVVINVNQEGHLNSQLRRAFCWLLPDCLGWFEKLRDHSVKERAKPESWNTLSTQQFRRPGNRTWTKIPSALGLHVIHGPNGSGKSSLAEAFEYAVTGLSSRLDAQVDYAILPSANEAASPLIYKSHSLGANGAFAKVVLKDGESTTRRSRTVPPAADDTQAFRSLPGNALRFDQTFIDKLVLHGPSKRYAIWFNTYFPKRDKDARSLRSALRKYYDASRLLLVTVEGTSTDNAAQRAASRAAAIAAAQAITEGKQIFLHQIFPEESRSATEALLIAGTSEESPLVQDTSLSDLKILSVLKTPISITDRSGAYVWTPVQPERFAADLRSALQADLELASFWQAQKPGELASLLVELEKQTSSTTSSSAAVALSPGSGRRSDYTRNFNNYLHTCALIDLLGRAKPLAKVAEATATSIDPLLQKVAPKISAVEIETELAKLIEKRAALRAKLNARSIPQTGAPPRDGEGPLTVAQLSQLEAAVAAGALAPAVHPNRAGDFRTAVEAQRVQTLDGFEIGRPGWTDKLAKGLRARQRLLDAIKTPLLRPLPSGDASASELNQRVDAIVAMVDAVVELSKLQLAEAAKFQKLIADGLEAPLDELLSLLTPASWAYPEVEARPASIESDTDQFELTSRGMDVEKVLNTAEINTLALCIHLLCAPNADNPWQVLFLDDPLQSMDELTVTNVARGLARLLRLWKNSSSMKEWEVVLLLHGEENCQRILMEAPAAFYHVPWLALDGSSGGDSKGNDVVNLPGTEAATVYLPEKFLVEERPAHSEAMPAERGAAI